MCKLAACVKSAVMTCGAAIFLLIFSAKCLRFLVIYVNQLLSNVVPIFDKGILLQIMELLEPEKFTAAAMCALTFYFAKASVGRNAAQNFFRLYLLPRIRDDISEYRRLNFHLARALQHALFQPAAFTTGFLLPLCKVPWTKLQ